ncbi:MAG: hypothetical protein B7X94_01440 [Hydrogenophilales bacterium 17-62-8]|nr:MAG: hypothetical protein B7X94_01440 [Hydrogenophilales bacterium 17-62-8]
MRIRSLLTLLAFALTSFVLPATADSSVGSAPATKLQTSISPEACIANAEGMQLAQIQTACCKAHKGICGCRAGKIVCCDNTTSKEPGCTCHGDEGFVE